MYRCNDCGCEFCQPKAVEESRGEFWGIPCSETMYYCPNCESDDFDETDEDEPVGLFEDSRADDYYDELMSQMVLNEHENI
jgi:hypothetical protein